MASIQQSLNQALYQAQIGVGLYAHSPTGQAKAREKTLEREIPVLSETSSKILENIDPKNENLAEAQTQLGEEALRREVSAKEELALLKPTDKNIKSASFARSALAEQLAIRAEELKGIKEGMKERIKIFETKGEKQ